MNKIKKLLLLSFLTLTTTISFSFTNLNNLESAPLFILRNNLRKPIMLTISNITTLFKPNHSCKVPNDSTIKINVPCSLLGTKSFDFQIQDYLQNGVYSISNIAMRAEPSSRKHFYVLTIKKPEKTYTSNGEIILKNI